MKLQEFLDDWSTQTPDNWTNYGDECVYDPRLPQACALAYAHEKAEGFRAEQMEELIKWAEEHYDFPYIVVFNLVHMNDNADSFEEAKERITRYIELVKVEGA